MRVCLTAASAAMLWTFAAHAQPAPTPMPAAAAIVSPQARIETDLGTIVIALDRANAPKSVANFIAYARVGHYDGTMVYRAVPSFVIQMGSYQPGGIARPAAAHVPLETANGLHNVRGAVAVARLDDPNSGSAEFFIDLADLPALDAAPGAAPNTTGYAVFGHVVSGMDVADRIAAAPKGGKGPFPPGSTPLTPVLIKKVTVVEAPSAAK
jgi:cyclophilin family peptidyl-prolyl cis-trans isomerase